MLENALLEGLVTGAIALTILLIGSVLMWLTLGKYMITNYATKKFESALMDAIENPKGQYGQMVAKLSGLGLKVFKSAMTDAYKNPEGEYGQMVSNLSQLGLVAALKSLSELIPEDPSKPAHPMVNSMFRRIEDHVYKGIMGTIGNQMQKLQGGEGVEGGFNPVNLISGLTGGDGKSSMAGLGNILGIIQTLANTQGQAQAGGGTSPPPPPLTAGGGSSYP